MGDTKWRYASKRTPRGKSTGTRKRKSKKTSTPEKQTSTAKPRKKPKMARGPDGKFTGKK